ncbi:hypothetical protein EMIHUDRAFT_437241, partial [Emiliania huxleyi CCMP1516]|uniref:Uncharacterized protein n=2 Tax=Emiliania huxleyi TaxID=2903 RepID=A0A0D3INS8_EMIH1
MILPSLSMGSANSKYGFVQVTTSPDTTVKWTDFLLTTASLPTSKAHSKSSLLTTASWLSASLRKKPRTKRYAASSGTTVSQQTTAGTPLWMHAFASSRDSQPLRTTSRTWLRARSSATWSLSTSVDVIWPSELVKPSRFSRKG